MAVDALQAALPATEFTPGVVDMLRRAYASGRSMSQAFGRVLEHVLGPYGLVVYDASDPASKPLAADLFARALADPGRTSQLAAAAGEALESARLPRAGRRRRNSRRRSSSSTGRDRPSAGVTAWPSSASARCRWPISWRWRGRRRSRSAPTCCSGRSCRTPSSPPPATWADRANSRIKVSSARSTPTSACRCRSSCRAPRPRSSTRPPCASSSKHEVPFAAFQRQDELTLNQLLESQLPAGVEDSFAEAGRAIAERLERRHRRPPRSSTARSKARPSPRSARCSTTCRRCTARSCMPPRRRTRRCAASSRARRPSSSRTANRRSVRSARCGCSTATARPPWTG